MHDIDRAMFEVGYESNEMANEAFEAYEMHEAYEQQEFNELNELQETAQLELAAELLEVNNEYELEQFLGKLISSAGSALRGFANSDTGRAVGGILKSAAKNVLPQLGRTLGNSISPAIGDLGAQGGRWLGNQLEMEGLSAEDREFETARAFVRFSQDAARQAFEASTRGPSMPSPVVARRAAVAAARRNLPALAPMLQTARPFGSGGSAQRGPQGPTRSFAPPTTGGPVQPHGGSAFGGPGFGGPGFVGSGVGGPGFVGSGFDDVAPPRTGARSGRWVRSGNRVILLGL